MKITSTQIGLFLGPLLFLLLQFSIPETLVSPTAPTVLAVAAWMMTWWISEAVPIPVTALLPLILFPVLGIMPISDSAANYANPIVFLFMGGFMLALGMEKHRLHERIALSLVKITGTSGNGIIAGFMIATGFISMWISNTATTMMMLPIALSVIRLIHSNQTLNTENLPKNERNFALGLMLIVGYAASLGGMATLIGTPPNVVFKGLLLNFYNEEISFADWILIGLPASILLLASTYLIITRILFPNHIRKVQGSEEYIRIRLQEMGPMSRNERLVLIIFSITSFLWIFQNPINHLTNTSLLNDTVIAMTGGLLLFAIPVNLKQGEFLLNWNDTKNLAWGILILFGGGLCLADGLESAGILQSVGQWVAGRSNFNIWLLLGLIVATVVLSELMSNVALVNIFVPVVFGIAEGLDINPIFLAIPVTLAASIGFMFPIATPPNAIVFSSGYIRIKDMARAGLLLDLSSVLIIWILSFTLIKWIF